MAISKGTRLGLYEITGLLGAGGMGEVYRARDSKLNRDVAIKVLPAAFADDLDRMARFQREAQVLASLNHPHIAAIYGLEESGGTRALVMELVEGPTLADRIRAGSLPQEEALQLAKQIAEALEYAHEHGVVHRDLKPANMKVTQDGAVKLLDFGLAKALEGDPSSTPPQDSPTLTLEATRAGVILGTAAYMSPEQAKGKVVDRRADIWAFGVVLYEMLTGKQLYTGETSAEILASVIKEPVSLNGLLPATPPAVRNLLSRCLERDLRRRLQHIGEARIVLEDPLSTSLTLPVAAPPPSASLLRRLLPWGAVAVLSFLALGLAIAYFRAPKAETPVLKFTLPPPEKARFALLRYPSLSPDFPAISPDGHHVAFVASLDAKDSIWIRDLDSLAARPLAGTEGANGHFWSPDSRFIAFFADGKLKKVDVAGGPALSLSDAPDGHGGSWSKKGVMLFASGANPILFRVQDAGGIAAPVTTLDEGLGELAHFSPSFLPDGRHFLYNANGTGGEKTAVYVADLDSKARRLVLTASSNAVYVHPGYVLFLRERTLMAQPFDPVKAMTTGDPAPIAEQIDLYTGAFSPPIGIFSASENGIVTYTSGALAGDLKLTWFDRAGKAIGTVGEPGVMEWPTVSPDGNTVVADRLDLKTGFFDLWLHDLKRGTATRITFNSRTNDSPIWSPDGSHIAFSSTRDGYRSLYQKAVSGTAQDEALDRGARQITPNDWSRDGRYIFEDVIDAKTHGDIWVFPLFGDRKPFPYVRTSFNENYGKLSPNGQWLAYTSDETGREEVYVQTFPASGHKYQVSTNGGAVPTWSPDGKELFFLAGDRKLMAVQVKTGAKFEAGVPKPLFDVRNGPQPWFDVSKDGRFLVPVQVEQTASVPITVVINWPAALKK